MANIHFFIKSFERSSPNTVLANHRGIIRTQTQSHREIYQSRENIVNTRIEEICTDFTGRHGRNLLSYGTETFLQPLEERQPFQIRQAIDNHRTHTLLGNSDNHLRVRLSQLRQLSENTSSTIHYNNDNARRSTEAFLQSLEERQPIQIRQAIDNHRIHTLLGNSDDHLRVRLSHLQQLSDNTRSTAFVDENHARAYEHTSNTLEDENNARAYEHTSNTLEDENQARAYEHTSNILEDENQAKAHEELIKTIHESYPEIHDKLCSPDLNLICPLTHELIIDPVKADDGVTYERAQIAQWLNNNSTSPITRSRMSRTLSQDSDYKRKLQQAFDKEQNEQIRQCSK